MINFFIGILKKIKNKGIGWFIYRIKHELINPRFKIIKIPLDFLLNIKSNIYIYKKINRNNNYLYAIYDLEINPITFNIIEYLCIFEIESVKKQKKGFVLVIVPKMQKRFYSEYDKIINEDSSNWRINNILIQTASIHDKCKGIIILPDRQSVKEIIKNNEIYPYLYDGVNLRAANIIEFYKNMDRPKLFTGLSASVKGKEYIESYIKENSINKKIITIVLRNYDFDPIRNSKIDEWAKFVNYLLESNYHPVIIPDTDDAFNRMLPFDERYIFRDCCWNIGLRMALYESSYLTLSVPTGPVALALFNKKCSVIVMNFLPEGSITTSRESFKKIGYEIGENYRFLLPNQKVSYLPDYFSNIKFEFDEFINKNNK